MKKLIPILLVLVLLISAFGAQAQELAGGWTMLDVAEPIPEEAMTAFNKAMEGFAGVGYVPAALLGTQVVAGTNYLFLCKATPVIPDPVPYWATVTVYAALDGSAEILHIGTIEAYPPVEE